MFGERAHLCLPAYQKNADPTLRLLRLMNMMGSCSVSVQGIVVGNLDMHNGSGTRKVETDGNAGFLPQAKDGAQGRIRADRSFKEKVIDS
jgi:hypothetical protein